MKVSVSKFYKSVTGSVTAARETTVPALKRWGVPFDEAGMTTQGGEVVDVAYLPKAQEAYAAEQAALRERVAKKHTSKANHNGDAISVLDRNTKALQDLTAAIMLLVEKH